MGRIITGLELWPLAGQYRGIMKPVLGLIFLMVVIFPTLGSAQAPVPAARAFDFTLQREIHAELGVK